MLTNKYVGAPLDIVRSQVPAGFEIVFLAEQTQEALLDQGADADYIFAGGRLRITREVLDRAEKLRMIQRSGVGLDGLDLDAIREKGIPLYVNRGVNAQSVAEHTLLLMLACLRRLPIVHGNTKNGVWKKQEQGVQTFELHGKTVGIIGMGSIARRLVGLLKPFGVKILYYDVFRQPPEAERELGIEFADVETLLRTSDIVSMHCALTDDTRGMMRRETIGRMKDGAILVNTARGGLVRTADLADALRSGKLSFAGIDVHETEPMGADDPLRDLENVILTPHIAGVTADSFRAMMHDAFRNIECFEKGCLEAIEPYRYL